MHSFLFSCLQLIFLLSYNCIGRNNQIAARVVVPLYVALWPTALVFGCWVGIYFTFLKKDTSPIGLGKNNSLTVCWRHR